MVADRQLYDILDVPLEASADDIKRAYKKLAVKYHPDKQTSENKAASEAKFKEISEAYSILGDAEKKKAYDTFGTRDGNGGGGGFDMKDMGDIFSEIFAGGIGGGGMGAFAEHFFGSRPHPSSPRPDVVEVGVGLDEIRKGSTKKITYEVMDKCDTCDGIGAKDKGDIVCCIGCNGRGVVMHQIGPLMLTQMQCPSCGGKGETIKHNKACPSCKGDKRRMFKRSIDLKIPTGVPQEFMYTIAGKGSYHLGAQKNVDMVLRFVHKIPNGIFIDYQNMDVHTTIKITVDDVFCGFEKKLQLYNKTYTLRKYKYFDPNQETIVKNLGIPAFKTKCYGNLVLKYEVAFPSETQVAERMEKYKPALLTIFKREPISATPPPPPQEDQSNNTIIDLD